MARSKLNHRLQVGDKKIFQCERFRANLTSAKFEILPPKCALPTFFLYTRYQAWVSLVSGFSNPIIIMQTSHWTQTQNKCEAIVKLVQWFVQLKATLRNLSQELKL